jgi:hypothetical protein
VGRLLRSGWQRSPDRSRARTAPAAAEVFGFIDAGFLTVGILAEDNLDRVAACGRAIDALAAALAKVSKGRP